MTENDKIEYKDIEDLLKNPIIYDKRPRKIKFMQSSFIRIKALYNRFFKNFRINHVINKLEKNKDKLASIEIPASDFQAEVGEISRGEQKITKLSNKIANLEAKLHFLTRGIKPAKEAVESRAIKLKNHMMKNFVYSSNSIYSVNPDIEKEIFEGNDNSSVIEEESVVPENNDATNLDRNEIKSVIDKTFEQEESNENNLNIDKNNEINENEDIPESIKVSRNGSAKAKTNLNPDGTYHLKREEIDEELRITRVDSKDLGYLKGEETAESQIYGEGDVSPLEPVEIKGGFEVKIPEKVDSSEFNGISGEGNVLPIEEKSYSEGITNHNITLPKKIEKGNRVVPLIVPPRDSEESISKTSEEDNKFKFVDEDLTDFERTAEEIKDSNLEEQEIYEGENIEENYESEKSLEDSDEKYQAEKESEDEDLHFDYSNTTPEDLGKVVENATKMSDLKDVLARVEELKAEKRESEAKLQVAETEANESEEKLRETEARFREYSKSLEEDCNNNSQKEQELLAKRDENMAKIDAMMSLMTESATNESETIKKGR